MMKQPSIRVGIISNEIIRFKLNGIFRFDQTNTLVSGEHSVQLKDGAILFNNQSFSSITLHPVYTQTASFDVFDVIIGVQFHWERHENQKFKGNIHIVEDGQKCVLINELLVEDYLLSVISSEMRATSSLELLKAHAIISRSWLLAQLQNIIQEKNIVPTIPIQNSTDERICWYDRENHYLFDVCADDHCQRYQGITKVTSSIVKEAIQKTAGMVLMYQNQVCDARFSKCCGGITEEFQNCWQPIHIPYLESVSCTSSPQEITSWEDWIRTSPPAFCNTADKKVLSQILNDYDRETPDFYRWQVSYSQEELSSLIHKKTGIDFGCIKRLIPLERGKSGRIIRLKIEGTLHSMIIGKELEIRKVLSASHLYSSAFVVDNMPSNEEMIPQGFILTGAGWGHGVGLCQIGAAMMAEKGYSSDEILRHYFKCSEIKRAYF